MTNNKTSKPSSAPNTTTKATAKAAVLPAEPAKAITTSKVKASSKPKAFHRLKSSRPVVAIKNVSVRRGPFKKAKNTEEKVAEALSNVPRITNETVAEHREDVLRSARKYIYPLEHSRHRVVRISIALFAVVIVAFFISCGLALYKFQNTSGFIYGVTKVVPFPIAKAGKSWVSYESYLFELRRNMHYYQTQQQADFGSKTGKVQLERLKQQAFNQVTQDAYVKQLAASNHVSVDEQSVSNEVALVRSQNRLGSSDQVFKDVLNQFWGWNETDFKRELRQQLLQQKVVSVLDTATVSHANSVAAQLKAGADFATLATANTDDPATKTTGGQYPNLVTVNDRDLPPASTQELFTLKAGQVSPVINTGYTLEIVKVIDRTGSSLHAAHIQFTFKGITTYTKPLQAKHPIRTYLKV